jgi:predicted DNA-binding transcriptional regulator YafY
MVLLEKKRISAKELAAMFEVSLRTIYRDIDAINLAGIPIAATPGMNGGYYIMESYKIDKKVFSASDIAILLMGIESISSMMEGDELIGTLAKIRNLIPTEQSSEIEFKSNQVYIDMKPWKGNDTMTKNLESIKAALQKQVLLSFLYSDRKRTTSARKVEPYRLILKGNHWYLQGYCYDREDFRLFKLSRMEELVIYNEKFKPKELPKFSDEFSNEMANRQISVLLRIHESIKDNVLDYCNRDQIMPCSKEHYFVHLPFIADDAGYNLLFSLGDQCECLEPQEVRLEMIRRIKQLMHLYERA